MNPPDRVRPVTDPPQRPRFAPIRATPPGEVLKGLSGAALDTGWAIERFGNDGGYPNGGIWQVTANRLGGPGPFSGWVKRTGASYLGDSGGVALPFGTS